jgi:hypothetical protein
MVRDSGQFRGVVRRLVFTAAVILGGSATTTVSAQGVGLQGGFSIDPEQGYVGSHFETRALVDRLHFRPNIEGGFGQDRTLATLNFEFLYKFPLEGTAWTLYQGTGPSIVFERFADETDVTGGVNVVFGVAHASGFFTEFKVGAYNAPNLKFGIGYTVR